MHQLDSNGGIQLFLYLDKDTEHAKKLTDKYLKDKDISDFKKSDIGKISAGFFKKLLVKQDCRTLFEGFHIIINHLIDYDTAPEKDPRVEKAILYISKTTEKSLKVKDIAAHVCLSESRLRYLFKKQVGQPIQSFMLWIRVINSLNLVLQGKPLTETAYDVGFWDASHMNRSYKELLGVSPSALKKYEKELKIVSCHKSNLNTFKTEILKEWSASKPFKTITI